VKTQYSLNGFFHHVSDAYADREEHLAINYFPPIDLSDDDYELGLMDFETYYTIPNVNASNNKFYFEDDAEITIPEGSYEIQAINEFLNRTILRKHLRLMIHSNDEKKRSDDKDKGIKFRKAHTSDFFKTTYTYVF